MVFSYILVKKLRTYLTIHEIKENEPSLDMIFI